MRRQSFLIVAALAAVLAAGSAAHAQSAPGADLVADIAAVKAARVKVETDLALGSEALKANIAILEAAIAKLRNDAAAVRAALAPGRTAVQTARRALDDAERAYRRTRSGAEAPLVLAAQNALIDALQNLSVAQEALIVEAARIGLPPPSDMKLATKLAADAYRLARVRLSTARTLKDAAAIAAAEQALAQAGAALAAAQARAIDQQQANSMESTLATAERLLARSRLALGQGRRLGVARG